jgi:hypothetical protein
MIATRTGKQLSIRFDGTMTSPAGEIQADLPGGKASIIVELADHKRINRHHMRPHIPGVSLRVGRTSLDQARHVAIDASNAAGGMRWVVLKLGFLEVTILAFKPGGLQAFNPELHYGGMWIVASEAIQYLVLTLRKVAQLVAVLNEAVFNFEC